MKSYFLIVLGVLGLMSFAHESRADFSFFWRDYNYFNAHYRGYSTLDLDHDESPRPAEVGNTLSFSSFQLRMKPSLSVTDRVAIHAGFDVFSSTYAGSAHEGG